MAKVQVLNLKGEKVKDITLKDSVWNIEINEPVMHDAIVLARASLRQGTASTKTRSEVSGGGRKPYKQKVLVMLVKVQFVLLIIEVVELHLALIQEVIHSR